MPSDWTTRTQHASADVAGTSAPALSDADLRQWSTLLGEVAGWTFGRLRAPTLARGLTTRMTATGCGSYQAYFDRVSSSKDAMELAHLVELLVNGESSFFRNEPIFRAIGERVIPEILARRVATGRPANVLSAGCSTGQEPYSLALAFAERAAEDTEAFTIWGADISRTALAFARRGRYTPEDIESIPRRYRGYLKASIDARGMGYEISEEIKARTTFAWANLDSPGDGTLLYDLIVCQNVLIYFHARSAARVVHHLCGRLAPGGYLFLGPGEAVDVLPPGVEVVPFPQARAFHRPE